MTDPTPEEVSSVMSKIGSTPSKKKRRAARRNVKKAQAARRSSNAHLELAYQHVKKGGTRKDAFVLAKCRYHRFRTYIELRFKQEIGL